MRVPRIGCETVSIPTQFEDGAEIRLCSAAKSARAGAAISRTEVTNVTMIAVFVMAFSWVDFLWFALFFRTLSFRCPTRSISALSASRAMQQTVNDDAGFVNGMC